MELLQHEILFSVTSISKDAHDLGWWPDLTEKGITNIEDILAAKGETVRRIANETDRVEISEQLEIVLKEEK